MQVMLKILLIKRGALGDMLLATPLIRQLKTKIDCKLDLAIGQTTVGAVKDNSYLDHIFILPDQDFALSGFIRLCKFMLSIRKKYDYIFILDKHWYFNLMAGLAGSMTVGYCRETFSQLILDKTVKYDNVERYHSLYYLDLLQASGLSAPDYNDINLDLKISAADKHFVDQLLREQQLSDYVVVVNSGGNNSHENTGIRMLPLSKIIALLEKLLSAGQKVILLGGKVDYQNYNIYYELLKDKVKILKDDADKLESKAKCLFNWAGRFSLAQSAYLISKASRFYTTDCGAMHLGVAMHLGNRMTAFFGPTNPAHILPVAYLKNSALWQDQNIYDPIYQLYGKLRRHEPEYFSSLNI